MQLALASGGVRPSSTIESAGASTIGVFRRQTRWLGGGDLRRLAATLGIDGPLVESDARVAIGDGARTLSYLQPPSRLAGQLVLSERRASGSGGDREHAGPFGDGDPTPLARQLLASWGFPPVLAPPPVGSGDRDGRHQLQLELEARTEGREGADERAADGRVVTTVVGQVRLGGFPVVGPRGKVQLAFSGGARPRTACVALWDNLKLHEQRALVGPHEALQTALRRLLGQADTRDRPVLASEVRLVYFADEYRGGADLLVPEYIVAVELGASARQLLRVSACR